MASTVTTTVPCDCCDLPVCCNGAVSHGGLVADTLYFVFYPPGGDPGVCGNNTCTKCSCGSTSGSITLTYSHTTNPTGGTGRWDGTGTVTVCGLSQTYTIVVWCFVNFSGVGVWGVNISGGCFANLTSTGGVLGTQLLLQSCSPFYGCGPVTIVGVAGGGTPDGFDTIDCFGCPHHTDHCYWFFSYAVTA